METLKRTKIRFKNRRRRLLRALLTSGSLITVMAGCQLTPAQKTALDQAMAGGSPVTGNPGSTTDPADTGSGCYVQQVTQPDEEIVRSVDILFVADTSGSMSDNRAKVADGLYAFVGELPSNVDYRIAMTLAHGSRSAFSGKLWTINNGTTGYPYVLDSATLTHDTIQRKLKDMMLGAPNDPGTYQGEEGMFALKNLIEGSGGSNLAAAKAKGFFRDSAALAVVFISDENDICAVYPAHPGTQTGLTDFERDLRAIDCSNGIDYQEIINAVTSVQGTRPFALGAIVNNDITKSYTGNDGYGWGYMDVIDHTHGISVDIEGSNYATGLSQIGQLVTRKLTLITDVTLQHADINPATIEVKVDGTVKSADFDSATRVLHFDEPGQALSQIIINYCLNGPTPTPTPTASPSPTPTPTPSPTPTPTPTPGPTPPPQTCEGPGCNPIGV